MTYVPPEPAAGVPERTPVVAFKVTPDGRVPVSEYVGAGKPVAVTVKVPATAVVNVTVFADVMTGPCEIVRVNVCVAVSVPLVAFKVMT